MAKRTKQDDDTRAAIEQMENEGGPAAPFTDDDDAPRLVIYHGGHPLIRRCGYAFEPHKAKRVPAGVAAVLVALRDFEDSTPASVNEGDSELPPAA
jgi:hypothetical protein